jgi:hypothetical protein
MGTERWNGSIAHTAQTQITNTVTGRDLAFERFKCDVIQSMYPLLGLHSLMVSRLSTSRA